MSLEDIIEMLRNERIARKYVPCQLKNSVSVENKDAYIEERLRELKKSEPSSDDIFRRLAIIGYEYGFVQRHLAYAEIFKGDDKERKIQLASAKLELADLITQINMLCITMDWDIKELRKLGLKHLEERHEDFKRNKWNVRNE